MNNLKRMLDKYEEFEFQSSMYETPEFTNFCTKLKRAMQKDIRENFPDLKIAVLLKGHFEISGFIIRKTDGAIFYFSIGDVRGRNSLKSLQRYRSARYLKDYLGGINHYTEAENLLEAINKEHYEFKKGN